MKAGDRPEYEVKNTTNEQGDYIWLPNSLIVGVKGESSIQRYCLPYGVCEQTLTTDVNSFKVGNGIMPVTIGATTSGTRQVIGGTSSARPSASVGGVAKSQTIRRQIVPLKWYEQDSP